MQGKIDKKILVVVLAASLLLFLALLFTVKKAKFSQEARTQDRQPLPVLASLANDFEVRNNLVEARKTYQRLVNDFPNSKEVMAWQKKTEELNIKLLFSPLITPDSSLYEIKKGDNLSKIAKEFKTTVELLKKSNNLKNDKIFPGRKLKVWMLPFSIFVDKSQNTLVLKTNEEVVKTYVVATGKNNSTPVGKFKITNKLENPTWFKAGSAVPAGSPKNVLGTRWLGFDLTSYGIHGTTEPQALGSQVTEGCVRMSNQDVEELYILVPVGTEVNIVD